jgi:hypothetical protein
MSAELLPPRRRFERQGCKAAYGDGALCALRPAALGERQQQRLHGAPREPRTASLPVATSGGLAGCSILCADRERVVSPTPVTQLSAQRVESIPATRTACHPPRRGRS